MKGNSITANGQNWLGEGNGFTFSDNRFADGTIGLQRLADGQLEKFTVSAMASRSSDAFDLLKWKNGAWQENLDYARNTSITFTKRDLYGNVIDTYDTGTIWNTVDNTYGAKMYNGEPIGADQPINQIFLGMIQGNTLNSNFTIHLTAGGHQYGVDRVFAVTNGYTIAGEYIGDNSVVSSADPNRWLWHPAGNGRLDGCWGTLNDPGFVGTGLSPWKDPNQIGSGAYNFTRVADYLQNRMGVYKGLNIGVQLQNKNSWAWTGWRWK